MKEYFTRLTPNFNNWEKPSGRDGKCKGANPLYEETNGFGWEEWLFEDYNKGKEVCLGFLQAFNDKNNDVTSVEVIHLYTRICDGIKPKQYYVGLIKDVKILHLNERVVSDDIKRKRRIELNNVGLTNFPTNDSMWKKCFNIQFERKNVFLKEDYMQSEVKLKRGQFRFSLYDVNKHPNFLNQINRFKTK
jgi:hypothetical protein